MKRIVLTFVSMISVLGLLALRGAGQGTSDGPKFTADGQLVRPENYREWVFLSSGLGMTYGPLASEAQQANPLFDNVFVSQAAYRAFRETGKWPDQTIFVLEVRSSESKGSINSGGRFQTSVRGIEAEVKNGGKWAFYGFGADAKTGRQVPATAACYTCHSQNGAVDNTFVQFYPTLLSVAKEKGTLRADALQEPTNQVTDVMCGMGVDPATTTFKSEYKGKTYYFCSKDCKDGFDKAPADHIPANGK